MSRTAQMVVWISIVLGILMLTHAYLWLRLVRDPVLANPWRCILTGALMVCGASIPAVMVLGRAFNWDSVWSRGLLWVAFVWMGLMFYLFVLFGTADLIRFGFWLVAKWGTPTDTLDVARRQFLARATAGGVAGAALGVGAFAFARAQSGPLIEHVSVKLARWPAGFNGFKIAQISDLHVGGTIGRDYVERVVALTMAEKPDLIAVTGDLVDGSVSELQDGVAPLASLKAPHGVYFVTGNHEYYSGAEAWLKEVTRLGMRPLRNERVSIGAGTTSFDLLGIDDITASHPSGHGYGPKLEHANRGRDANRESILLAHQPKAIFEASKLGIGLVLAGHTHAGQLWPFYYLVKLAQPYIAGLSRHNDTTQIYVNRGTGHWGPPMRFPWRAEVTLLTVSRD